MLQIDNKKSYSEKVQVRIALVATIVLTFVCFTPSLNNELLIWDDHSYIVKNINIQRFTLDTFAWAFTDFFHNSWFPLTWISLALDYAIWGLNPAGYHLTNIIIHALNAGLFFLLSLELLKKYLEVRVCESWLLKANRLIFSALLATLFFSLHPLRVESVAWAAERKDVLSLFFGIPAFLAYLRYTKFVESNPGSQAKINLRFLSSPHYWLMMTAFCLSLLSKPMLVTLPVVLIILDWFPLKRFDTIKSLNLLLEKVPILVCSVIVSVITTNSQGQNISSHADITNFSKILIAFKSVVHYLWLTLWPLNINPLYLHPGNINTLTAEYVLSALVFLFILVFCLILVKRFPVFTAVWLIYLITLLPVLGIVQVGPQAMAARYTYLPSLPISLLASLGVTAIFNRVSLVKSTKIAMISGIFFLMLLYCYGTVRQITYWKDDVTLWTRSIELQTHPVGRAFFQRSAGYELKGDLVNALADVNQAAAIAISKGYRQMHTIYNARARILAGLGDFEGAIADYSRCLETDTYPITRSMHYMGRGLIYQKLGRNDLASKDFALAAAGMPEKGNGSMRSHGVDHRGR